MIRQTHTSLTEKRSATFSDDDLYRYELEIEWDAEKPPLVAVCLNPSKATHLVNDPTVERMCRRARDLRCGAFVMLNLFGFRSTSPTMMKSVVDPVGPENDTTLFGWFRDAATNDWPVLLGWGAHGDHRNRDLDVIAMLRRAGVQPMCLGVTSLGRPKHPLYIGYNEPYSMFPPLEEAAE